MAAFALAEVVTVLFGGVLGDRLPRQVMMQGSSAAAFLTQGVVAVALIGGWASIPMLTVMGVANGCLGALAGPSSSAMTRQTVDEADLPRAVAGRRLSQNAAMVLGFSLAGVLVSAFGSGWAIAIDAATYAVAALCFGLIRVPAMPAPESRASHARRHAGRRGRGLPAHLALAADRPGAALPPVLRRGAVACSVRSWSVTASAARPGAGRWPR